MLQPTSAQKILRVVSIIAIVGSVLTIITAILLLFSGSYYSVNGTEVEGLTAAEAGGLVFIAGIVSLLDGVVTLIEGLLGMRAAKNNQKIMPVWYLAIIALVLSVISCVATLVNGPLTASNIISVVCTLVYSGLMLKVANTIKMEAGK